MPALEPGQHVVLAIDVAKRKFVAAFSDRSCAWLRLLKWEHPRQVDECLGLVGQVRDRGHEVIVGMEPTGTYGDALRHQLGRRDIDVHRASPKHVHDAAEIYDGVPSKHDAKDAAVLAWLYAQGRTTRWLQVDAERRQLRTLVDERDLFEVPLRRCRNKLEAKLARHFPELERLVEVSRRRAIWTPLAMYPSPQAIAANEAEARALLLRESRGRLAPGRVDGILAAARRSCGDAMTPEDERFLRRSSPKPAAATLSARPR